MFLHVFSDLHIRANSFRTPVRAIDDADVVVCAGDVSEGVVRSLHWLRATFSQHPIVFVCGNHEFYGGHWPADIEKGRQTARDLDITFLEDDAVVLGGVRYVGCSLWTNYDLFGLEKRSESMIAAGYDMMDHHAIRSSEDAGFFKPEDALHANERSQAFLRTALSETHDGRTAVITHHCPDAGGVHSQFAGNALNPAFCNDLDHLVEGSGAELWLHGHVHHFRDVQLGSTRVVCNPLGYPGEDTNFVPDMLVEV